ncbi:WhiB family transcriptional regulator [Pengzhenrongella sicca]|uniref:Transcriptional regulator WhiB n=1 Tax=Pengzhenrongella sicca TaxID=2819238 RepID=A0A8A4ZBR5_9MICO|nr:WhiB family transcriptional regulator [Pengzhenrongella sicca]QTE27937.1 WhiB family transcriptional regulator [Pengzhenrongella sicca]
MTESSADGPIIPWNWQSGAACQNKDETLFFHPPGERGSTRRRRDALAKAICATCPVIMQCRAQALKVREPYGVWGGLSEHEREALLPPLVRDAI